MGSICEMQTKKGVTFKGIVRRGAYFKTKRFRFREDAIRWITKIEAEIVKRATEEAIDTVPNSFESRQANNASKRGKEVDRPTPFFWNLSDKNTRDLDPSVDCDVWDFAGRFYGLFLKVRNNSKRFCCRVLCHDDKWRDFYIAECGSLSLTKIRILAQHCFYLYAKNAAAVLNDEMKLSVNGNSQSTDRIKKGICLRCHSRAVERRVYTGALCRPCVFEFRAERLERFRLDKLKRTFNALKRELKDANQINLGSKSSSGGYD